MERRGVEVAGPAVIVALVLQAIDQGGGQVLGQLLVPSLQDHWGVSSRGGSVVHPPQPVKLEDRVGLSGRFGAVNLFAGPGIEQHDLILVGADLRGVQGVDAAVVQPDGLIPLDALSHSVCSFLQMAQCPKVVNPHSTIPSED